MKVELGSAPTVHGDGLTTLRAAPATLSPELLDVVEYRKSGLSLNHIVGCPLDCGYCVRHIFDNFEMKRPHQIVGDAEAVQRLLAHWAFVPHRTPLQLFNRATEPFLPSVKEHMFAVLEMLDSRGLTNLVLLITRWRISEEDVVRLEQLQHLRVTVLVTWSGITDKRIEPIENSIPEGSLQILAKHAKRTKKILYWRPLIAGLNDRAHHVASARSLSELADATVFTGLFFRAQIREYFRRLGLEDFYDDVARRKVLPAGLEKRILRQFPRGRLFRKTSCGVAFVHAIPDYNGHVGISEICDICPADQLRRCEAARRTPSASMVEHLAQRAGLAVENIAIDERCIEVVGSTEQQRYFLQHALEYQVHDRAHPHFARRHGRAEIGW